MCYLFYLLPLKKMASSFHAEVLHDQVFYFFVHQFYLKFEIADETTLFTRKYKYMGNAF